MTDDVRAAMASNLADFLIEIEAKAKLDSDPISGECLTDDGKIVGVVALIRGPHVCEQFLTWAHGHGYATPGKPMADLSEPVHRAIADARAESGEIQDAVALIIKALEKHAADCDDEADYYDGEDVAEQRDLNIGEAKGLRRAAELLRSITRGEF